MNVLGLLFLGTISAQAADLTIVTFNAQYFGMGGSSHGTPADEKRDAGLREFFSRQVPAADVIIVQEVVDVPRFQKILPPFWNCLTYKHPNPAHQHVAICISPIYRFLHEPSDKNDVIDQVAVNERSRPALHLILADNRGNALLRLVGVHLKAFPEFSETRDQQSKIIAKYLTQVANPKLPILITGDFNTYDRTLNGRGIDDNQMISQILNASGLNLAEVPNANRFTYRTTSKASKFDRFWISRTLRPLAPLWVHPICNAPAGDPNIAQYNQLISDHCPVALRLHL